MAQALAVGNFVKARIWCSSALGNGQASVNTLWYVVGAIGTPASTDQDVATTLDALIAAQMKGLICNISTYKGVQAQICSPVLPFRATYVAQGAIGNAGAGTAGANGLPPQTSGLISFQSALANVQNRGRFYIPFPAQLDDSGGGAPTGGYVARANALAVNVAAGLAPTTGGRTATLVRVLVHRLNKAGLAIPATPVISSNASTLWATQRRRGDFGRQNVSPI